MVGVFFPRYLWCICGARRQEDLAMLQGVDEDDLSEMEFEELPNIKTMDSEYREVSG